MGFFMFSIQRIWPFFCILLLNACVLAPGMNSGSINKSIPLPTSDGQVSKVKIKHIDAKLIVELQEKNRQKSPNQKNQIQELNKKTNSMAHKNLIQNNLDKILNPEHHHKALANYDYKVGPSDILTIIVWEHPELTIPAGAERSAEQAGTVVGNDGRIYFPYAGVMQVAGKTLSEIRAILTEKLNRYIENVKLDVRIAQYNHKRVYVVGEVKSPSIQKITHIPPTIIEMINGAGGFTPNADSRQITLTRNNQTYRVDLLALYEKGDTSQNIFVEDGDVINVQDSVYNKIFVLGEVNTPGSFLMNKSRKSLAEALGDAGGVNQNTSNPEHVYVLRYDENGSSVFHLDAKSAESFILADQFPLKPRDVVYVDSAKVVRWNRVIQNISGTVNILNDSSSTSFPLFQGGN